MNKLSLQSYLDAFGPRFARCERAGTVNEFMKGYYLTKGLNRARLDKVIGKFKLKTNNPNGFDYQKIQGYLNDAAQREMEIESFNPALRRTEPSAPDAVRTVPEAPSTYMFPPGTLKLPENMGHHTNMQNKRPKGQRGVQMPPSSAITQAEVDDLITRVKGLQLNEVALQAWNYREKEILQAIPSIMDEVKMPTQLANATAITGIRYTHPKGNQGPNFTLNAMNASGINDRITGCLGCGDESHRIAECEERAQLAEQGWVYYDVNTRRLRWGSGPHTDAGPINGIGPPGKQNATIIRQIHAILHNHSKPIIDPRKFPCPFQVGPKPAGPTATTASLMGVISPFEDDGILSAEEFNSRLRRSMAVEEKFGTQDMETNSMGPGASQTQCYATSFKPQGPSVPFPMVRNNHNRDAQHFEHKRVAFEDEGMDIDYQHAPKDHRIRAKGDSGPRKIKLMDAIEGKPDDVVRTLLQTIVQLPLGAALANMPEVRKSFTKTSYTRNEADQLLDLNVTEGAWGNPVESAVEQAIQCARDSDEPSGPTAGCDAVLASIPDYVEVEARQGIITRCGIPAERGPEGHPALLPRTTLSMAHISTTRSEYDRDHGLERLRRDCPKAWIQIHGIRLEALLDSGAELNTIRWKTALAAGLSVTSLPREMENAQLRTANGGRESFEGIVWRVPIQIGSVEVRANLFVVRSLAHPLILGNPFMAEGRASFEYNEDGNMYCKLWSTDKSYSTRFRAAEDGTRRDLGTYATGIQQSGNGRGV